MKLSLPVPILVCETLNQEKLYVHSYIAYVKKQIYKRASHRSCNIIAHILCFFPTLPKACHLADTGMGERGDEASKISSLLVVSEPAVLSVSMAPSKTFTTCDMAGRLLNSRCKHQTASLITSIISRSEERRVGKECLL